MLMTHRAFWYAVADKNIWLFVGMAPCLAAWLLCRRSPYLVTKLRYLLALAGALIVIAYVGSCLAYLTSPSYSDQGEVTIAAVSWYAQAMKPVYEPAASPDVHNLLYGPYLFLVNGLFLKVIGGTVFTSKLAAVCATLASVFLLSVFFWRFFRQPALVLVAAGIYAAVLSNFGIPSFSARSDPLLLFLVTAGLLAATTASPLSPVIFGAALGVSMNLKLHGFAYFLPLIFLAWRQENFRRHYVSGVVAAAAALAAPFLLPNVSLLNYVATLREAGRHGLGFAEFTETIQWFFVLVFPVIVVAGISATDNHAAFALYLRDRKWFLPATLVGAALVTVAASKHGSGHSMWIAYLPVLGFLFADIYRSCPYDDSRMSLTSSVLLAFGASWLIACYFAAARELVLTDRSIRAETPSAADLEGLLKKFGDRFVILCGVGNNRDFAVTFPRPLLAFAGFPIGVDPTALMDSKFAGVPEPSVDEVVREVTKDQNRGKGVMWLIPRNARPFSMNTFYSPNGSLFDESFQERFLQEFRLLEQTQWFDVYTNLPAQ